MRAFGGEASFCTYEGAGSTRKRVQESKVVTASIWGLEIRARVTMRVSIARLTLILTLLARCGC